MNDFVGSILQKRL